MDFAGLPHVRDAMFHIVLIIGARVSLAAEHICEFGDTGNAEDNAYYGIRVQEELVGRPGDEKYR